MKRGWIGAALLIALLIAASISAWDMYTRQQPLEAAMDKAAGYALEENWQAASRLTRWTTEQWQAHWRRNAAFSDHGPMEEIDTLFAQLAIYETQQDPLSYAVVCAQLAQAFSALADGYVPNWWNLL